MTRTALLFLLLAAASAFNPSSSFTFLSSRTSNGVPSAVHSPRRPGLCAARDLRASSGAGFGVKSAKGGPGKKKKLGEESKAPLGPQTPNPEESSARFKSILQAPPLLRAVWNGDVKLVKALMKQGGVDVSTPWGDQNATVWRMSCERGVPEIVKEVLKAEGLDVNEVFGDGATPLLVVSIRGFAEVVKVLLNAGADPDKLCVQGHHPDGTPLLYSALWLSCSKVREGQVSVVKELLRGNASVDLADQDGATALVLACESGFVEAVRMLIEAGANVDVTYTLQGSVWTLLSVASKRVDIVKELIKGGADVNAEAADGQTPLVFASRYGRADVIKVLIKAGAEVDRTSAARGAWPLALAAKHGQTDAVRELIEGGANVSKCNTFPLSGDVTPVVLAAEGGHMSVLKELFRAGAAPELLRAGASPEERFMLLVGKLIAGPANVDAGSGDGSMLLRIACEKGFAGAVRALLTTGADVSKVGEDGLSPLEAASGRGGSDEVVRELIRGGAAELDSALCTAAKNRNLEVV